MMIDHIEIKNSLEYKENKRLSILFGSIILGFLIILNAIIIFTSISIRTINYDKSVQLLIFGCLAINLPFIPLLIHYYINNFTRNKRLLKTYKTYNKLEITLNNPIDKKFNKVRFLISINVSNNHDVKIFTSWFPINMFSKNNNYLIDLSKGIKAIIGYNLDSNKVIIVKVIL